MKIINKFFMILIILPQMIYAQTIKHQLLEKKLSFTKKFRDENGKVYLNQFNVKDCLLTYLHGFNGILEKDKIFNVNLNNKKIKFYKNNMVVDENKLKGITFRKKWSLKSKNHISFHENLFQSRKERDEFFDQLKEYTQFCRARERNENTHFTLNMKINPDNHHDDHYISCYKLKDESGPLNKIEAMEKALFKMVNNYRVKHKKSPLYLDENLSQIARNHSASFSKVDARTINHDRWSRRYQQVKLILPASRVGENVAFNSGYNDPVKNAFKQWKWSPGHNRLMLSDWLTVPFGRPTHATHTGIGITEDHRGGYYFTQIFAKKKMSIP